MKGGRYPEGPDRLSIRGGPRELDPRLARPGARSAAGALPRRDPADDGRKTVLDVREASADRLYAPCYNPGVPGPPVASPAASRADSSDRASAQRPLGAGFRAFLRDWAKALALGGRRDRMATHPRIGRNQASSARSRDGGFVRGGGERDDAIDHDRPASAAFRNHHATESFSWRTPSEQSTACS